MAQVDAIPRPIHRVHEEAVIVGDAVADAVAQELPLGSRIKNAKTHRKSFWTDTFRIDVELPNKTLQSFFLKTSTGENGKSMLEGEFEGAKVIHEYTPKSIPRPIACGSFKSDPNTYFYLCEFVDMKKELPDMVKFSTMLAKIHEDSMLNNDAPVQFGFDIMTYEGSMYQDISWCDTWEGMYSQRFQSFVDQERVSQGPSEELDEIVPQFKNKVIPRLLRPLVTHGRSIKPVALHADLWSGNIDTNRATGEPIYFDPSVFWGHYEYDLQCTRTERYGLSSEWMDAYFELFSPSEPQKEAKDRNLLYAM
ncbi:Protein-ribulosamine 3-kinase [Fusarium sp. LHS14.1]|nr:Protein-ribulosamine 3-kinase [Fusarium sp. LHS14.1]